MRTIESHKVNPANDQLTIMTTDQPGSGGANHRYEICGFDATTNPSADRRYPLLSVCLMFQNGPINEAGVNGITHEALLAIVADRLKSFQAGAYACDENALALNYINLAQATLQLRTQKRMERGVEGTHEV